MRSLKNMQKKNHLNNIFVSTTFLKDEKKVTEALSLCKKNNVKNIELGSNHIYEPSVLKKIKSYKFRYLVHNYFPVPKKSFVVNIASLDKELRERSINHIISSIKFADKINASLYTFHPGFLSDPKPSIGSKINYDFIFTDKKNNYNRCFNLFLDSLKKILLIVKKKRYKTKIAIETEGSISKKNLILMQKPSEYKIFMNLFSKKQIGINLNIGHLNLASKAFNFSRTEFVNNIADYIVAMELSHNSRLKDDHLPLKSSAWYWKIINDDRFTKCYKILEFRNTNIQRIIKNFKLFND